MNNLININSKDTLPKKKMKGVVISALGEKSFTENQVNRIKSVLDVEFHIQNTALTNGGFVDITKDAEILAITRRPLKDIDAEIIDSIPNLKGMAVYTTGCEWIDVEHLSKKEIKLSFLPDYATVSVAEHTLAVMLLMSRRIHLSSDKIKNLVPKGTSLQGWELKGKKLGIVGYGRIGQEVGKLSKAFGMEVSYYDKIKIPNSDIQYKTYSEILETSDVVVLICSKIRNEPPIITDRELAIIKKGAYIINTARADLVDNKAMITALRNKTISGYTVDDEIVDFNNVDNLDYGRIFQTGHTAWYSKEAIQRGTEEWVDNIVALASGEPQNLFIGSMLNYE